MNTFLLILAIVFFLLLLVVTAIRPARSSYSTAELKRRAKQSDAHKAELDRELLLPTIETFLRIDRSILFVLVVVLFIAATGWGIGIVLSLVIAVLYPVFSRYRLFVHLGDLLYLKIEPSLLTFMSRYKKFFHALRDDTFLQPGDLKVSSRDELSELIDNSKSVLSENERALLVSSLAFANKSVEQVMTPRAVIDFIKGSEFLGPLVLSELHTLGHSRLPVIGEDLNQVMGVLHLRDLLSLDVKRSTTAEKAMEKKVYYIHEKDSLEHALGAFLKTRHHLFIVINDQRETVGLITLEDVLESLIGRRIVDEDDIHADLRAVAEREGKLNNRPSGYVDL